MGRGIAPALLGIAAGTALQLHQAQLWPWWVYAAMLPAGCIAFAAGRRLSRVDALACMLAFALAAFGATGMRAVYFDSRALHPSHEGLDIVVTGVVAAMPQRSDSGLRFRFDIESASAGDQPVRVVSRALLGWYGGAGMDDRSEATHGRDARGPRDLPELRPGERWRMTVRLKAPHGNANPHGFDYELWLWDQGVQATGYVRNGARDTPPERLGVSGWHPIERARQSVRDAIFRQVSDRNTAGVVAALVTGDQNAIERADWDVFRATGVAHLMSISGLHITMFAWAAAWVVSSLWRRSARLCLAWPAQHAALAGGLLLATGYAIFAGWGVPAQRTIWMLAAVAALRFSGRSWPWPHVWLLACSVVVVIDPWAMLHPGFWLSFVAVGVLFAAGGRGQVPQDSAVRARFSQAVRSAAHEQAVVTVALAPLGVLLFNQISVVGLLANAVAIPWVTLVVTPLALGGVALPQLWSWSAGAVSWLHAGLQLLAGVPFASLWLAAPPLWAGLLGMAGGLLLVLRLPWHARMLGVAMVLPVLLWKSPRPLEGEFEVIAADIGQGNALLVRTAAHTLAYDTGPRYGPESDAGHRVLVPLLRALGERVDTLVLSHSDSDHTGGAAAVLATHPQAALLASIPDTHELRALRPGAPCMAGQRWRWDGIDFSVLHPPPPDGAKVKPNAVSCVLRVSNGRRTVLLAGDIESPQEGRLVSDGAPLRADVLLVPHHGSKTSSTAAFLDAAQPSIGLVQAGYRNRFGHPAQTVVQRYTDRKIRLVETARCGAATWRSDRPGETRCEREDRARYWHHRVP